MVEQLLLELEPQGKTLLVMLCIYAAFAMVELYVPAEEGQSFGGRLRNLWVNVLHFAFGGILLATVVLLIPIEFSEVHSSSTWELLLRIAVYLAYFDFLFYWYHRAEHSISMLWPIHELHHTDSELNALSSYRSFWLELPIQTVVIGYSGFALFGIDTTALLLQWLLCSAWLAFTHANIRLNLGPLTPVICGPHLHRIHHSKLKQHRNKNFAQFLPIYDVLFGTYYRPEADEYPPTGIGDQSSQVATSDVLFKPFRVWYRKCFTTNTPRET